MRALLPEKTVEVWTAIAVTRFLPNAEVWSPPNHRESVDQSIRAGKTWAFELKTTYEDSTGRPRVPINMLQLEAHASRPPHGVPVLYLLPWVPWSIRPTEPIPVVASQWTTFPWWAWVVSANRLRGLLAPSTGGTRNVAESELIRWRTTRSRYQMKSLARFLIEVGACTEPPGWVLRATEDELGRDSDADGFLTDVPSSYMTVHLGAAHLSGFSDVRTANERMGRQ